MIYQGFVDNIEPVERRHHDADVPTGSEPPPSPGRVRRARRDHGAPDDARQGPDIE